MFKRIAMISVLMVGSSLHAMDGRLQVAIDTPVAKTLQWLSSGKPGANFAAGAIAICIAKPAVEMATWPVRAWLSAREKQNFVGQLNEIRDSVRRTERAVELAQKFTPEQLQKLELFLTAANASEAQFAALNRRLASLEAQAPSREAAQNLETIKRDIRELKARTSVDPRDFGALSKRVEDLEKREPISAAPTLTCPGHEIIEGLVQRVGVVEGRMGNLEKEVSEFKTKNADDHKNIRADNLHMFTEKLKGFETDLTTLRSQVKFLQDVRTGQSANQK